jgi:CRP-like cAMP-binding protein
MNTADKVALLSGTELFGALSPQQLASVAGLCEQRAYVAGALLCHQTDPGTEAFVIVSGEATVSIDGEKIAAVRPGEVVGEGSLVHGRRNADVKATTDVTALVVDYREIDDALSASPGVAGPALTHLLDRYSDR